MVNRIVVGAHYGLRDWLVQRLSAVVIAVFAVVMVVALASGHGADYAAWKALFSHRWMRWLSFLFVVSLLLHAWVGMRDIWMDYVKGTGLRLTLEVLTVLWLVGCGGWALQVLWRL